MNLDLGSLFFRLGIDQSGFRTGLDKAESDLGSSANKMGTIARSIASSLGVALTVGGAVAFGRSAVKEFEGIERASASLRQVLTNLGSATGYTRGELEKMAISMSALTRFENQAIWGAEAILLRYREIGRTEFPQALRLTIDLAEKMGGGEGSLASAATLLGRALADPETASRALYQANVVLSDSEKELIKHMMKVNDIAGAQKIVMDRIQGSVGGAATDIGSMAQATSELSKAWRDMLGEMGKSMAPDVESGASFWARQWRGLAGYINEARFAAEEFSRAGMGKLGYLPLMLNLGSISDATHERYLNHLKVEALLDEERAKRQAESAKNYSATEKALADRLALEKASLEFSKTKLLMEQKLTDELERQAREVSGKAKYNRYDIGEGFRSIGHAMGADKMQDVPKFIIASADAMKKLEIEAYRAADVAAYFGGAFVDAAFAGKNALNVLLNALRNFVSQAITEWIRLKVLSMSDWFKMGGGASGAVTSGAGTYGGGAVVNSRASLNLSIIDKREASAPPITVERGTGANGADMIQVIVESTVKNAFNSGKFDSSMRRNYRLSRVGKAA